MHARRLKNMYITDRGAQLCKRCRVYAEFVGQINCPGDILEQSDKVGVLSPHETALRSVIPSGSLFLNPFFLEL